MAVRERGTTSSGFDTHTEEDYPEEELRLFTRRRSLRQPSHLTTAGRHTRREFLRTVLGGVAAATFCPDGSPLVSAANKKPLNFVFLLIDDFGWMDFGANNPNCFYETPNIDRLARSGMNFTNGYAANPVCSPTRYSIMTGKYPSRVDATNFFSGKRSGRFNPGELNDRMPLSEVTLAEALKGHGYRTAFAGKWHLGPDEQYWPENQGFDVNIGGWATGWPHGGFFAPFENPRLKEYPKGSHLPKVLTDESLAILDEYKDSPFLLYLAYYSVHTPLQGREDLIAKYEAKKDKLLSKDEAEFGPEEQVWPVEKPRGTMFAWAPLPEKCAAMGSLDFSLKLLQEANVAVAPGQAFGEGGDGFVRMALVENEQRLRQAVRNISRFIREKPVRKKAPSKEK